MIRRSKLNLKNAFLLALIVFCMGMNFPYKKHGEVGKVYRGWKEGEVDIHHIYTGRGESSFLIFPDGTNLLIDAGDWDPTKEEYPLMAPQLPDSNKRSGQRIAEYILSVNPKKSKVDYLLISHFHSDHFGDGKKGAGMTVNRQPNYQLSGVAEVAEYIQFEKIIDRDYPAYNFPQSPHSDPDFANYYNFIQWKMSSEGVGVEKFDVGSKSQIALKARAKYYPDFQVRNLFNNGTIWNEKSQSVDSVYYPKYQKRSSSWNENTMSNGLRLTYGNFSYYTGGDLSGGVLDKDGKAIDIEGLAAEATGEVDVAKANHHAYKDAMTPGFINHIRARFFVVPVWDRAHIQPEIIDRMKRGPSDNKTSVDKILFTYFPEDLKIKYQNEHWISSILSNGHAVIKVYDQGRKYKIYLLDAHSEERIVKAVYGPFKSKGRSH